MTMGARFPPPFPSPPLFCPPSCPPFLSFPPFLFPSHTSIPHSLPLSRTCHVIPIAEALDPPVFVSRWSCNFTVKNVVCWTPVLLIYIMWNAVTDGELIVSILTKIGPRTWICVVVCLLQWKTLLQYMYMYLVKMCKILLIFVAEF